MDIIGNNFVFYGLMAIGTHIVTFLLASAFFIYENKKKYRETQDENGKLKSEIEKLNYKIENLKELIIENSFKS